MTRRVNLLAAAVLVAAISIPALSQQKPADRKGSASAVPAASAAGQNSALPAPNDPTYIIGAEDILSVKVWKEPEISASAVPVRPDGKISLPLVDDVQAAGLTPVALAERVKQLLSRYVTDPLVTVTVNSVNSRKVYVLGQVGRPGAFPLLANMTVLQVLSSAGGITEFAKAQKIYVLRSENGTQSKLPFNYKDVIKGKNPGQNVILKAGDTIVVP